MPARVITPFLIASLFLAGCNSKKITQLSAENDSLKKELENRLAYSAVIFEVTTLLDSIDISRRLLKADLKRGTNYNELSARLRDINRYVKQSEEKIATIEKELRISRNESFAYTMMANAYKGEVGIRDGEVHELESAVAGYQDVNEGLLDSVKFQGSMINDMVANIEQKEHALSALESKVHQLERDFRLTEAEVYYARARLVEEAAHRTKLAPQKRRQSFTEALELYRKAYSLGKEDAKRNIITLEEMFSPKLSALPEKNSLRNN